MTLKPIASHSILQTTVFSVILVLLSNFLFFFIDKLKYHLLKALHYMFILNFIWINTVYLTLNAHAYVSL